MNFISKLRLELKSKFKIQNKNNLVSKFNSLVLLLIVFCMLFVSKVHAADNRVIYNIEQTSMYDFKITLSWSVTPRSKLQITSYNKVDDNTVEIYYKENNDFEFNKVTINTETLNMKMYERQKPNVILKDQNGKVDLLTDLPEKNKEMKEAIQNLYSRGIINGYSDGSFKPNNTITKEEFASMFLKEQNIKVNKGLTSVFADVSNTSWSKDIIMTLNQMKIINGLGDGLFGAQNNVTLAEVATMVSRAKKLVEIPTSNMFIHNNTSHWANKSITMMITNEYIKTTDDFYSEKCQTLNLTRGQIALILNRN